MTAGPSSPENGTAHVLAVCDGLLREAGRRQHRFSWLRDPDAPGDEWLVVDAYYPVNKLVVYTGDDLDELSLYHQLVPVHGLYLLSIQPAELPDDPIAAQAFVRKQLEDDGWSPRPETRPVAAPPPPAQPVKPGSWTEVSRASVPPPDPKHPATAGFGMGLVLFAVVLLRSSWASSSWPSPAATWCSGSASCSTRRRGRWGRSAPAAGVSRTRCGRAC